MFHNVLLYSNLLDFKAFDCMLTKQLPSLRLAILGIHDVSVQYEKEMMNCNLFVIFYM